MTRHISDFWRVWIQQALPAAEEDGPDEVSYELGLAALPAPEGDGQFIGFMIIEMMMPSGTATLETGMEVPTVVATRGLLEPWAPREQVQQLVGELLADLIALRASGPTTSPNT